MATEAHVPEAVSFAKEEDVDRSLTIDQCSPVESNKTKGDLDQHLEIHSEKSFADGENVQVEYSTKVESKDKGFEISEGEHFLDPLSENFQADQSGQAGMEILKSQVQLQKGTQVGGSAVETYAEENEVIEERKEKFEKDIAAGIIPEIAKTGDANLAAEKVEEETTVDQHVQVISDQQDSIRENVQCLEKEVDSSEVDITGAEKADGNAESYHKEAADLLEATTFQEYEAPTTTLDLTDSSFKKDLELETNVCNTSDTTPILQEEFEEKASTKVTSNDEEHSQQTLQNYEPKEELKNLPEVTVMPEDTKTEPASENADEKSCTEEARTIQNTPEYIKKEEAHVHCPKQNDTITEEVLEARSTEQETAEDASPEIHPAENYPQELNEETSRDYQVSAEAAQLSTDTDEKNEECAIKETTSSLVEEDITPQVSKAEEVHAINLKEEEKEEDTKCEEPTEVADTTREVENEEHVNDIPKEKGLNTVLSDQAVMEIQTAEGEGERELKEIEENKEAVDNDGIVPEEGLAATITDQPSLQTEDIELQAEENVNSKDKLEEQTPTAADEGGSGFIEAQTENNEQVTDTDIASEEKGLETICSKEDSEKQIPVVADEVDICLKEATEEKKQEALPPILTGQTPSNIEGIDVQADKNFSPEERLEELIPAAADECDTSLKEAEEENKEQDKVNVPEEKVTILTEERALDNEETELQVEKNVGSKDDLEKQIPTTADEGDKSLKEIEEDNKEAVGIIDISPEVKGLKTFLTDQTTHNAEDTDVKEEDCISLKDIEGDSCTTEPQKDNKEEVSYTDITPEEKISNSQEKLEDQVPVVPDEGHTSLNEAEEENKEHIISRDTPTEEKDLPTISTYDTAFESKEVELQSQENIKSTDNLEKNIPTPADEAEHGLVEVEAEKEEQATITYITSEIRSVQSILTSSEEMKLLAEEIVKSADCLEEQISTAADEGEDTVMEVEADSKEHVAIAEITPVEKDLATILTEERSLENEQTNVQVGEYANSNENLEEEISAAPELGDTWVKEDEVENKEHVKSSDSSHEEKDQDIEYTDVQAGEDFNSEDIADKQIPAAVYEVEPDLQEVEAENKAQVETTEIALEEKDPATILIDENVEGIEVIDVQAEEINSKEVSDRQIPAASDEGETDLKVAEADIKEQEESTGSISEQKGVETILSDERALDQEDVHVQEQEKLNSNETLESQILTTVGEGETELNEGEADSKEQVQCTESTAEENELATISRDESVKEQDVNVKAEENPEEAVEGEEKAVILDDIPNNVYDTELVEEATAEQSYQAPSQEEVEPKIAVEVEKPEDHPERSEVMVQEVLDEPKIISRDVSEEQIIEGNVASCTSESIEEDTVTSSPENEKETEELKEEGSCTENMKEENASDLTREYVPEDATEQIKDEDYNAVKSENEIVQDSQTVKVDDSSTCETKNAEGSEEILSTLPVKHDEVRQGEALNVDDGDNGAIAVTETSPEVPSNDEEDPPQVLLQKSEPVEETTKLPDVEPEETTPEPSSETAEVTTCTKEEIQESLDKQNDTNESATPSGEVLETAITEALLETHTVDDTAEKATEHQACIEAAELSIEGEKENSEDQTTREVSSSLIGEDTTEESSKKEEKNELHVECKEAIEEAKSEVIEDTSEPKPISEEESNKLLVEDNSVLSEASEKEVEKDIQGEYSSTVRSFDSDVVSDQTGLTEATTEDKELVETTHNIAPEEKDNEATDVYSTKVVGEMIVEPSVQVQTIEEEAAPKLEVEDETDKTDDLPEKYNKICEKEVLDGPKITDREITEENVAILATAPAEEQERVKDCQEGKIETEKSNEEGSSIENLQENNSNNIATECIPVYKDEKLKEGIEEAVESKEQNTGGNVKSEAELVEDDTVENSQDNEKESIELKESTKEESTRELSPEYIQENGGENSKDDKEEAVKSEAEILEASETVEVVESPACETSNVERSEETLSTLPPVPTEALKQENIDEDTVSVQGTKENDNVDGAVTLTETSVEVPSNSEDDSAQVLQKYEPEEQLAMLRDMAPEETKPELSSENAEVVTCASEETRESLEIEKDTKEIDTSTGEPFIEATELSTEGEKEEQTTKEVSSSLKGDETTEQSLKEEEKEAAHEERKEAIEGTKEETNKAVVEDGSYLSEASEEVIEKEIQGDYSSTVRSLDSEDVSEEGGLTEAREKVETTRIAPETIEPRSQMQTLGEEAEPKSEVEDETDKLDGHLENSNQICEEVLDEPKITDRDFDDKQITQGFVASESVEETVKDPQVDEKERGCVAEGCNANDISTVSVPEVIVGETAECKEEILQESQKDNGDEETIQIKMAEDKGIVVLPEAGAEVTSTGEESSEVTQILELGEEHAKVETSNLETNEGSREAEVSNLALEKLESDASEETIKCSEVVPETDFKSPDVVAQDEVIAERRLDECISKESSTLLSKEKEVKASEDEHAKEVEVPTEGEDLLATRSVEEPCLSKEEPRELEVSDLAPEKLDTAVTEEETKETSETVSKPDSQSTGQTLCAAEKEPTQVATSDVADEIEVCDMEDKVSVAARTEVSNLAMEKLESDVPEEETIASSEVVPEPDSKGTDVVSQDEVIADQTLHAVISKEPSTLLSEIKEPKASEHEHEKEVEVPTEAEDLLATRSVEETCLSKEEPRELEVSDLAPEKLDTAVIEEETKEASETVSKSDSQSIAVVCEDEIITDRTRCEAEKELETQVETSDVADEIEVCDLEDKVSAAKRTEVETQDVEVSTLATEKLDSDALEEETVGSSEVVPEPDFKGTDVVSQDEVIADQTLDEVIPKEPSTLLSEIKELKASEHEHEKEVEVPTEEVTGESLAARSPEETCLPEEEPRELKVSKLALQKLENGATEEKTIEASETVSKSDSHSIGVVCEGEKEQEASEVVQETLEADAPEEETKDDSAVVTVDSESTDEPVKEEIIADQTLPEDTSTEQLPTPYSALPPMERELQASEHEHEITGADKNIEENLKEVEVPANEDKEELFATPAEKSLHTEEPRDTESVLHKLDAGETEEEIKNTFETVPESDSQSVVVAPGDDIIADQTPCEGITDTSISEERDWSAYELALAKLHAGDTEQIKEGAEAVPKCDSGIIEVVSSDAITLDQAFDEGIVMKEQIQSPSSTLLPEEKERESSEPEVETNAQDKITEQECTREVEVSADEDTHAIMAARPVEEECRQKEKPSELNVSEEATETIEMVSRSSISRIPSIEADPKEEITADETLSKEVTDVPSYTSLHEEKEPKASDSDLEKPDAGTPEEETKEGSDVIPQSISCEVSKDEIIADQLEMPSSALLPDENKLKASKNEHKAIIDDKKIEAENVKEVREPTNEGTEDVFTARPAEVTCLQKEESSDLKVRELAPEKLEADEIEEIKETFETVSRSDAQSNDAVSTDDYIADQTLPAVSAVTSDMPPDIPTYTTLPKENEEVKEDATELALEKQEVDATEEVQKGSDVTPKSDLQNIDVVVKDEIFADQILHEGITKEQLPVQCSKLLPEEKELKETEHDHGTTTQDRNLEEAYAKEMEATIHRDTRDVFVASSEEKTHLQKEEPRELKVSGLSIVGEEEVASESTDAVTKEDTIAEQTLDRHDEQLQIAYPTLLPKEKEEATVQKEEQEDSKVPELSLKGEAEEETKQASETAPEVSLRSIGEPATDEIVDQILPSLISEEKKHENTTPINKAGEEAMNVVETPNDQSRKDTYSAEETSIAFEEPRKLTVSDLELPSSQYTDRDGSNEVHDAKQNEASNEEKNLEVATPNSRAEDSCEATVEANQTAKFEHPNEEIKEGKEVAKDSQLIPFDELNIRESQQEIESREEKYPEEKNDIFTPPSEYHHEMKPDDKSAMDHSQDGAEGRTQETAIHLGLENQGDKIKCEKSTTEVTYPVEKDSSMEVSQGDQGEETNGTTQDIKQPEKESYATDIPISKDDAPKFFQEPKLEENKPHNDTLVSRETKEEKVCDSGIEIADPTSAQKPSSERLMEESTQDKTKVVTHLTEEKEPTVGKQLHAEEEEEEEHENIEEGKTDEEKEDTEHNRGYHGYEEPVIVEASGDTEAKVTSKKSHNILTGMGKSVKHSISKVKKAIIGKSSNSKTQSEK